MEERYAAALNLRDAGLSEKQVAEFLLCFDSGSVEEQIRLLRRYRPELMEKMHESQKKVDCLDFLICKLEKRQKQEKQRQQEKQKQEKQKQGK